MNDEQFRAIRGLLVTIVILLGLIAGILLALAWEYLWWPVLRALEGSLHAFEAHRQLILDWLKGAERRWPEKTKKLGSL
jgi:hypothetical protein